MTSLPPIPIARTLVDNIAELLLLLTRGAVIPRLRAAHLLDRLNVEIRHAQQEPEK
jgi:hypothetical protein